MRFILFIAFISYPAFAMFAPQMGPHTGMDPICLIALQAGMSGHSSTQQQLSLEDQIADIEARLEGLEDEVDEDRKSLLGNGVFKTSVCKNGAGEECSRLSDESQNKIRARSIVDNTIEHVLGKKDAPAKCAGVANEGVTFYFESFLPHIQYSLNLPLTLIGPAVAVAQEPIDVASPQPETVDKTPTLPGVNADAGRDLANECGNCTNVRGSKCFVPNSDGGQCPEGWLPNSVGKQCYKNCDVDLIEPSPPPPTSELPEGFCTDDEGCNPDKKCDTNGSSGVCVDRCTGTAPTWDRNKCVCEGDSCGSGKVCNTSGECENATSTPPACSDSTKPKWDRNKCVCEGDSCGSGKVCNTSGECENAPPPVSSSGPFDWCENCDCKYKRYFRNEGQIDIDGLCEDPLLLITNTDGGIEELARDDCKDYLQYIIENLREMNELEEERKRLVRKQEKEERTERRLARRCERNPDLEICQQRAPGATEAGTFCTSCFQEVIDAAYPKRSVLDKVLSAVVPLAGTGLAYYGIKEANELKARQGFPVDNSAMYGLAYPFITQMLYGGALTGRGRNSLACSPTAHMNPYGGMFSAYAHLGGGGMIPGMIPGIHGGFLQGGIPVPGYAGGVFNVGGMNPFFGPGANLYANMGLLGPGAFGPGANLYANMGLFGPRNFGPGMFGPGGNLYANMGLYGPGGNMGLYGPGGNMGLYGPGAAFGLGGAGGFDYYSHMQMQQRMQSYYMQLQQFQMEQQRAKQSIVMRYQQEAQSLAIKYQTFLRNMSQPGHYPYPPSPGGTPPYHNVPYNTPGSYPPGSYPPGGTNSGYPNPYQ